LYDDALLGFHFVDLFVDEFGLKGSQALKHVILREEAKHLLVQKPYLLKIRKVKELCQEIRIQAKEGSRFESGHKAVAASSQLIEFGLVGVCEVIFLDFEELLFEHESEDVNGESHGIIFLLLFFSWLFFLVMLIDLRLLEVLVD